MGNPGLVTRGLRMITWQIPDMRMGDLAFMRKIYTLEGKRNARHVDQITLPSL